MTYALSDFDLRAVPMPRIALGPSRHAYPRAYSSVLGLAVDNLVKWIVWGRTERATSFDATGHRSRPRRVLQRLLYPRHLRDTRFGWERLRTRWDGETPSTEQISAARHEWESEWGKLIAKEIVQPILQGELATVTDDTLARYVTEFIWSPQLRTDQALLNEVVARIRDVVATVDLDELSSKEAIIDANVAPDGPWNKHFLIWAIEPDLVLDGTLVDIKLRAPAYVSRQLFEDMIRYCLCFELHCFSESEDAQLPLWQRTRPRIAIERVGLFLADRGRLLTWDRRQWVSDAQLVALKEMYERGDWAHAERHQPRIRTQRELFDTPPRAPRRRVTSRT